ncbi:hypothetical protein GCM10023228_28470 [Brevibacillus fulvus]
MVVHPETAANWGIEAAGRMTLRYGLASLPVKVGFSSKVERNEILLSAEMVNRLRIPLSNQFDVIYKNGKIRIGPVIGFLITHSARDFSKNLRILNDYVRLYDQIGGTIMAFCLENVNRKRRTIRGAVYNPRTKRWVRGVYGYPSSFFIRSKMIPRDYKIHFQRVLGKAFFNNFTFDKWRMQQILLTGGLRRNLPPSQLYRNPEQVGVLLRRYGSLYIKPIWGSRGRSVIRVSRRSRQLLVKYRKNNQNQTVLFTSYRKLGDFLGRLLTPSQYIIQKAIPLLSYRKRIIDFRNIMVKNGRRQWEEVALIARFGAPNSVVSNISAGGSAERGEDTLRRMFRLTPDELQHFRERISRLSFRVARCLDEVGVNCGNMGVDIGVDANGHLWILEIQHNNPDPTLALDAQETGVYIKILLNHLLYLKYLAGFETKEGEDE